MVVVILVNLYEIMRRRVCVCVGEGRNRVECELTFTLTGHPGSTQNRAVSNYRSSVVIILGIQISFHLSIVT